MISKLNRAYAAAIEADRAEEAAEDLAVLYAGLGAPERLARKRELDDARGTAQAARRVAELLAFQLGPADKQRLEAMMALTRRRSA